MVATLLLNVSFLFLISIAAQLLLTVAFAYEAITTKQGTLCRVKCTVAAMLYCIVAATLTWFAVISPI